MLKYIRINYIVITLIFVAITLLSVFGAINLGKRICMAAFAYGSGSESDPYRLYDVNQVYNLCEISQSDKAKEWTKGKHFVLYNDIILNNSGVVNAPDGFYGILNGNGHTITINDGALFYKLGQNAVICNTNFKINLIKKNVVYGYGLVQTISQGATVENCHMSGTMEIDLYEAYKYPFLPARTYFSPFCIANNGIIRDCSYEGKIICKKPGSISHRYISVFSVLGDGEVERCRFFGSIDLETNGYIDVVAGISCSNHIVDSVFNGDIRITKSDRTSKYKYAGLRIVVYGLGQEVSNGKFYGNIVFDKTYRPHSYFIATNGTYEFNGTITRIPENGPIEVYYPEE